MCATTPASEVYVSPGTCSDKWKASGTGRIESVCKGSLYVFFLLLCLDVSWDSGPWDAHP